MLPGPSELCSLTISSKWVHSMDLDLDVFSPLLNSVSVFKEAVHILPLTSAALRHKLTLKQTHNLNCGSGSAGSHELEMTIYPLCPVSRREPGVEASSCRVQYMKLKHYIAFFVHQIYQLTTSTSFLPNEMSSWQTQQVLPP